MKREGGVEVGGARRKCPESLVDYRETRKRRDRGGE